MIHTFEIQDDSGTAHQYTVALHPARAGVRLSLKLIKLLGPSLLAVANISAAGPMGDADVSSVLDKVDTLPMLSDALMALGDADSDKLLAELFAQTARDGAPLTSNGSLTGEFDAAYRGNYAELWKAATRVVMLNNFLPLGSISGTK